MSSNSTKPTMPSKVIVLTKPSDEMGLSTILAIVFGITTGLLCILLISLFIYKKYFKKRKDRFALSPAELKIAKSTPLNVKGKPQLTINTNVHSIQSPLEIKKRKTILNRVSRYFSSSSLEDDLHLSYYTMDEDLKMSETYF